MRKSAQEKHRAIIMAQSTITPGQRLPDRWPLNPRDEDLFQFGAGGVELRVCVGEVCGVAFLILTWNFPDEANF